MLLASSAFAQSNVTVYGLFDVAVHEETHAGTSAATDGSKIAVDSGALNGSRLGFKGMEDLGDGMQAIFDLESGFNADTGTSGQGGLTFGRQAWVGLSSSAGQLTAGRQYSTMWDHFGNFDPMNGISNVNETSFYLNYGAYRINNSVKYVGNFNGLTLEGIYGFGEVAGSTSTNAHQGIGANYAFGNATIGAAFQQTNSNTTIAGTAATVKNAMVGTTYAIGPVTLLGNYMRTTNLAGNNGDTSDMFSLGTNYQATQNVKLLLGAYSDKTNIANTSARRNTLAALAQYSFSKRSSVYVSVDYTKQNNAAYNASPAALNNGTDNRTNIMLGMKHAF